MEEIDNKLIDIRLKLKDQEQPARRAEFQGRDTSSVDNNRSNSSASGLAKLPKLEQQKFDGKRQEWYEFRDSFCGVLQNNETLK